MTARRTHDSGGPAPLPATRRNPHPEPERRKLACEAVRRWHGFPRIGTGRGNLALSQQVALLQEAVEIQERLVQQLLDITKEQIIKIEVDTSGAESALGDFLENFDWGIPTGRIWPTSGAEVGGHPDFQPENKAFQDWNAALADARTAMENWKKEMGSLFDPLTGPGGSIAKMTKAWEGLTKLFGKGVGDPRRPQKTNFDIMLDTFKELDGVVKSLQESLALLGASFGLFSLGLTTPLSNMQLPSRGSGSSRGQCSRWMT